MLIRYVDGPYKGDTIETTCGEIVGSFIEDGVAWEVRYRVDRPNYTAREVHRAPIGALPLPEPAPEVPTVREATTEELLRELKRRADSGDPVAAGYLRPAMTTPMGGKRAPRIRAGFGQVPMPGCDR
jgi:hypothetical protein